MAFEGTQYGPSTGIVGTAPATNQTSAQAGRGAIQGYPQGKTSATYPTQTGGEPSTSGDTGTNIGGAVTMSPQMGSGVGGIPTRYEDSPIYHTFGAGKTEGQRRMAGVAEAQMGIALQQWDMYKQVFAPYEAELVAAHRAIIPAQTGLDLATIESQYQDVTGSMPINEEVRQQRMRELQRSEPVAEQFYDEALQGLNIPDRMNLAQADVQQGYDATKGQLTRDMSRAGLSQSGGRFTDTLAQRNYAMAKDIASARTAARRSAEDVNFGRLGQAMQMRGSVSGLPTYAGGTATNPLNQGMASIGLTKAGQTFQGLQGAQQGYANAAEAQAGQTSNIASGIGAIASLL